LLKSQCFFRYRLKGCGNNSEGFIVKNGFQSQAEYRQIRGSAFPHTAIRELVMSGRVADALAPLHAAGANTPVALMTYVVSIDIPISVQSELSYTDTQVPTSFLWALQFLWPASSSELWETVVSDPTYSLAWSCYFPESLIILPSTWSPC
jgi:hypothetical protein